MFSQHYYNTMWTD